MAPRAQPGEQGFTLLELIISLGLFALIAVAGLTLLDSVLGVQGRTERRLDRLADYQRAMFVIAGDLDQIARGDVAGTGERIAFTRAAPGVGGPPVQVEYRVERGTLIRALGRREQPLLTDVSQVRWRFFDQGWQAQWPPSQDMAGSWPRGVEVAFAAGGERVATGTLRRVIALPARPPDMPRD